MTVFKTAALTAILLASISFALPAAAEDAYQIIPSSNVRRMLVLHQGKVVTLQLASGKELTGTVAKLGEHLVQLSRLSGREFYDAAVVYDHIEAVIVKVRTQ